MDWLINLQEFVLRLFMSRVHLMGVKISISHCMLKNLISLFLTEVWDSKEHYEKYLAFRTEDGTVGAIERHVC